MTGKDVLRTAAREIGYHEGTNQSNKYGQWFGMNNCPWCVIFAAAWCYNQAGVIGEKVGRTYKEGGLYSCSQTLNWYRQHDPDCIRAEGVPGCLTIIDFPKTKYATDHMGIFVKQEDGYITTIDGNTSGINQANGGWVQQKTRKIKDLDNLWFIVPRELEEDVMRRYQTLDEIRNDAPWAAETVEKLIAAGALHGNENGLDLSYDMLRMLVINDNMKLYQ